MQVSRLKAIEIQGFKSFPDKIRLNFGEGITGVIGPNGSGKSNVSDAVRWVLGEQSIKTLRGNKMEDVIFNGTVNRKPVGFAQVSLYIDNKSRVYNMDSDEIIVTRKLYRSGDSEYRINNSSVRLKDIYELFMDTGLGRDGYSIIGQGKIAEIISAKGNQRREIFEEAAGIAKFRYKKEDSERRLAQAEDNLLRLKDILVELEERVGPLEEQSKKAKKRLELDAIKKGLEISLWVYKLNSSKELMRKQEDKIFIAGSQYNSFQEKLKEIENKVNLIFDDIQKNSVKTDDNRRLISKKEEYLSEYNARIAVLNNDILHVRENIQRIESQIQNLSSSNLDVSIEEISQNIVLYDTEIKNAELEIEKISQDISKLDDSSKSVDEEYNRLNQELSLKYQHLSDIKVLTVTAQTTSEQINSQLETLSNNLIIKKERLSSSKNDLNNCKELLEEIEDKINSLDNMKKGYFLKLDSAKNKYEQKFNKLSSIEQQIRDNEQKKQLLIELDKNMDGFAGSVKSVIKLGKSGAIRGIRGTVSQLIQVDSEFALALETALGTGMQNIVVDDEQAAKDSIRYLKENNLGRATFLPLTSVKSNVLFENDLEKQDGYVGIASELLNVEDKYLTAIRFLLGRTVIVQSIDDASRIAKKYSYKFKIVTLDGQVVNAGGSYTGGSNYKNSGILSRTGEIDKISKKLSELFVSKNELQSECGLAKSELDKINAQIDGILAENNVAAQDKARFSAEYDQILKQIQTLKSEIENDENIKLLLQEKLNEILDKTKNSQNDMIEFELEISKLENKISDISSGMSLTVEKKKELTERMSNFRLEMLTVLKNKELACAELEHLNLSREQAGEQISLHKTEISLLNDKISEIETEIKSQFNLQEQIRIEIADLKQIISDSMSKRQELEKETSDLRSGEKDILLQREEISKELARLEERKLNIQTDYDKIISSLWEEYQLTRTQAEENSKEIESESKTTAELNSVKNKIKALGNINYNAIDEFKEVSERYEFLKIQVNDIENSKAELRKIISELTSKMRSQFIENFEKINKNFTKIFSELFEGGKGELKLTDEEDILECGIEINVQPPGKVIKNLTLLSGGEQALVSIALYFAIMRVNPPPFCILDEIEAALDDVNVVRYATYLRKITDTTQFIVITHRRGTMEEADVLYGVTMQDEGISKILELDVSEVESKIGKIK